MEHFIARQPWSAARPETLVVCCSDGRWRAQIEEFISQSVSAQTDISAVPGGAAAFDFMSSSVFEAHSLEAGFKFLAERHKLRAVWLIAHQDCAYYMAARGFNSHLQARERQLADLMRARERIKEWFPRIEVTAVYASLEAGRVGFAPVGDTGRPTCRTCGSTHQ